MSKTLLINFVFSALTLSLCYATQITSADIRRLGHVIGSDYNPHETKMVNYNEPTCEQLRAMWRFSRRKSRAAELTNEIPTYRDPFAYNIWEKYPKARSVVSTPRPTGRVWSRPVYGRVVQNAPSHHPRVMQAENPRVYEGVLRYLEPDSAEEAPRRNFGLAGTFGQPNRMQQGSFQRLKELVWAERMKELHNQRLMEESSRPAAVKETTPSTQYPKPFQGQQRNNYVEPYNREKNTRLKIITDHFNQNNDNDEDNNNNNNNNNNNEEDNDEQMNREPMYRRPYRQRSMFVDDLSNYEFW